MYALLLGDGSVYVGLSYDPVQRLREHARNAKKTPGPHVAVTFENASTTFLALHGDPELVAWVVCPSRRHAHLYEAMLTARLAEAGVHVQGANYDQTGPRWTRNESRGVKLDGPDALTALVAQ